ncbi:MAG: hypothetical protein ACTHJ5_11445 [Ilyomonas sp.]
MKRIFLSSLIFILFLSCKKEHSSKVEIYMLNSFTRTINQSTNPATISITDAVLADTPLVADEDIRFYTKSTATFKLKKDIKAIIQNYGPDKGFAVTVNKHPVYFGLFHPLYMSSIAYGVVTVSPESFTKNELKIQFAGMDGSFDLQQLDKRNDELLINSLKVSGRLR